MKATLLALSLLFSFTLSAQNLYFPPAGDTWETLSPQELGWCQPQIDSLYQYLGDNQSKAFILLKDGKIVLEQYFNGHDANTNWYWASAGKTLTAFLVGQAQQEGFLNLSDTTSQYLGAGWTSCTPEQEAAITLWHQLTMTTGLDDAVANDDCTLDSCLIYEADAGTRWAYHNAPYTLLDAALENATGQSLNSFTIEHVLQPIGMQGVWVSPDFNNVFYSRARSMARFGLLLLAKGVWNGNDLLQDSAYFYQMTHASQDINQGYGYLTWLNNTENFMLPEYQFVYPGNFSPAAPQEMYAAMGRDGQYISVVPSQNLVWIRMGENPDQLNVPILMVDDIWEYINSFECEPNQINEYEATTISIQPNPASRYWEINKPDQVQSWQLYDATGRFFVSSSHDGLLGRIDCSRLTNGFYFLDIQLKSGKYERLKVAKYD